MKIWSLRNGFPTSLNGRKAIKTEEPIVVLLLCGECKKETLLDQAACHSQQISLGWRKYVTNKWSHWSHQTFRMKKFRERTQTLFFSAVLSTV